MRGFTYRTHLCVPVSSLLILLAVTPLPALAQSPGDGIAATVLDPAQAQPAPFAPADTLSEGEAGSTTPTTLDDVLDEIGQSQDPQDTSPGSALEQDAQERTGQAQSTNADDPAPEDTPSATVQAARTLLSAFWREAVVAGETTLGYEAWLAETLGSSVQPLQNPPTDQAGRTRTVSEDWLARAGPVALGEAGRVVTTFGSAIPTAFCAPLMVCYIELEPGEVLTDTPSWGDTVRWQVEVKTQGADPKTVSIEIKPADDARHTNIVIPTDRRLYTINLVNDTQVHTPILSFLYPDTAARKIAEDIAAREAAVAAAKAAEDQRKAQAAAARKAELARSGVETDRTAVPAGQLDFGFRMDGKAPFRPVRIFADGRRTYIDLHPGYRGALPAIVAGPGEENAALNTRVTQKGTRLVADRVISDIWLQSGKKRIRIRKSGP
ncbi:TrbG/VirB9 family P-type conjugative transfer protein [Ruegeria sp.]|uniref:TrbG/VirB9 family P-type conjugative transfer protein n=1 Tax=Ruegeria sp. TaxID=1879320 RepID=UPI003AFF9CC7